MSVSENGNNIFGQTGDLKRDFTLQLKGLSDTEHAKA